MKATTKVTLELDLGDSLAVGLSLCSVAKRGGIPASAIAAYDRVGRAMVKAAQAPIGGGVENPPVEIGGGS